jgi:hypothetical protein
MKTISIGRTMAIIQYDSKNKYVLNISIYVYNNINSLQFFVYLRAYTTVQRLIILVK